MKLREKWNNARVDWALVTGASSGIGLAIAEKLAAMGYNLVLVAIDGAGLREADRSIEERFRVKSRYVEMDLARPESAGKLHDWCAAQMIEPVILVNNAGIFIYNDVVDTSAARIETILNLHVLTTTMLARLFAADMVKRGRGYILSLSSYSAWMPWPGLALYSATKIYIRNFSRSLAAELRGTGVTATTVLPAGVTTDLYGLSAGLQRLGKNLGILLTPARTAEIALAAMFRGRKQYIPGALMRVLLPMVKTLPGWMVRFARRKTLRFRK